MCEDIWCSKEGSRQVHSASVSFCRRTPVPSCPPGFAIALVKARSSTTVDFLEINEIRLTMCVCVCVCVMCTLYTHVNTFAPVLLSLSSPAHPLLFSGQSAVLVDFSLHSNITRLLLELSDDPLSPPHPLQKYSLSYSFKKERRNIKRWKVCSEVSCCHLTAKKKTKQKKKPLPAEPQGEIVPSGSKHFSL